MRCYSKWMQTMAQRNWRSVKSWRKPHMLAQAHMMRQFLHGWPAQSAKPPLVVKQSQANSSKKCVTVKIHINPPASIPTATTAQVFQPHYNTKAKRCRTTTSTIQMRHLNWLRNSIQKTAQPWQSLNTPTHVAWQQAKHSAPHMNVLSNAIKHLPLAVSSH